VIDLIKSLFNQLKGTKRSRDIINLTLCYSRMTDNSDNNESNCDKTDEQDKNHAESFQCCPPCYVKVGKENCDDDRSIYAPDHPLPCGAGKGIQVH
jgi:hypothetical protein